MLLLMQIALAEPILWDEYEENWFHQIASVNKQIVFAGRVVQQDKSYAWLYSWDESWEVLSADSSEIQSMATNGSEIAVCGVSRVDNIPKAWAWFLTEAGESLREQVLSDENISDCTSIVAFEDGWLASITFHEGSQKISQLVQISAEGEVEEIGEVLRDIQILGIVTKEEKVGLAGYILSSERTSGWFGVLDSEAQLLWSKTLGDGQFNKLKSISIDQKGNLLSCGYTTPGDPENWAIWLLNWDWDGNILFETIWGGEFKDGCKNVKESSSEIHFVGDTESFGADGWDVLRGTLNRDGAVSAWELFGEEGDDYAYDFHQEGERMFWVGSLEEDGNRIAWAEMETIAGEIGEVDSGVDRISSRCGCGDSGQGLLLLPLIWGWSRRKR